MASNRKRPRLADDNPEAVAEQHSRVMNEANDAAQRALGNSRKSWMSGASRTGAAPPVRLPKVGLGRPGSASFASQETTPGNGRMSITAPSASQSLQPSRIETIDISRIDTSARTQSLTTPQTPQDSTKEHLPSHAGNDIECSVLSEPKNVVSVTTYISQTTSLPSPASSTGIASPNNMTVPLPKAPVVLSGPRTISSTVLGVDDVQADSSVPIVSGSLQNISIMAQENPPSQPAFASDHERLQLLLQRFGGLEGLEKQLAAAEQSNSFEAATAIVAAQANVSATTVETVNRTSTAPIVDLTTIPDTSNVVESPADSVLPQSAAAPIYRTREQMSASDTSLLPGQGSRIQLPAANVQTEPSNSIELNPHAARMSQLPQPRHLSDFRSGDPRLQGQWLGTAPMPQPPASNVPLQGHHIQRQQAPSFRREPIGVPSQQRHMAQPITPPFYQNFTNGVMQQQQQAHMSPFASPAPTVPLTLSAFISWKDSGLQLGWDLLRKRLTDRLAFVRRTPNGTPGKDVELERLSELWEACQRQDSTFLIMSQTYAISHSLMGDIPQKLVGMKAGLVVLRDLLSPVVSINWFAAFPCQPPVGQIQMSQWFSVVQEDLIILGQQFHGLQQICFSSKRLPYPEELEVCISKSVIMQSAIFKLFLSWYWPLPIDQCSVKAYEAYRKTQSKRLAIAQSYNADMRRQLLEAESRQFTQHITKYVNEHKLHRMRPSTGTGTPQMLQNGSAVHGPILRPGPGQLGTNPQVQTQGLPTSHPVRRDTGISIPPPTAVHRPSRISAPTGVQPGTLPSSLVRLTNSRVDQNNSETSDAEFAFHIMQTVNSNHGRVANDSVFPPAPRELVRNPFHHIHLRSPVISSSNIFKGTPQYKAYVAGFFLPQKLRPLVFDNKTRNRMIVFEVNEDATTNLARQALSSNGVMEREVQLGSQILRLRGICGQRPKTVNEWITRETTWPAGIAVLLNGKVVEHRKKPQHPKDLPVDVTSRIYPGTNNLNVSFLWPNPPPEDFCYTLAIEVVAVTDKATIISAISTTAKETTEANLKRYFQNSGDDDLQITIDHLDITVTDPFTSSLPRQPIRSGLCQHFQCFDLEIFIDSRPSNANQPDKFLCPICDVDARPGSLSIDEWMTSVVQKLRGMGREDAKIISIRPDLTWTIKEEVLTGEPSKDDEEDKDRPAAILRRSSSKVVEVIEID